MLTPLAISMVVGAMRSVWSALAAEGARPCSDWLASSALAEARKFPNLIFRAYAILAVPSCSKFVSACFELRCFQLGQYCTAQLMVCNRHTAKVRLFPRPLTDNLRRILLGNLLVVQAC